MFFLPAIFILAFFSIVILLSFRRIFGRKADIDSPTAEISVIIAARNEEQNISSLINSLCALDYPARLFEVILVDDNSEDATYAEICRRIAHLPNFRVIKAADKKYPAKKGALEAGISLAAKQFVVTTDADCTPGRDWLKAFSSGFKDGNDFLLGYFVYRKTGTFTNTLARFTALRNLLLTFTGAYTRFPYCAMGSSFGFRLDAFRDLGGYSSTLQTLSGDDDLLLREAQKKGFKTGIAAVPGCAVHTESKQTFSSYLTQKARHTSASNYYLPEIKVFLAIWHLSNLMLLFSPFLIFYSAWMLLPFIVKISADVIVIKSIPRSTGYTFSPAGIIILQPLYEMMLIVNYLNGTFRGRNRW